MSDSNFNTFMTIILLLLSILNIFDFIITYQTRERNKKLCDPYTVVTGDGNIAICKTELGPIIRGEITE